MLWLQLPRGIARILAHVTVTATALVLASCVTPKPPNSAQIPLTKASASKNCNPHTIGAKAGQPQAKPEKDWQACSEYRPVSVQTPASDGLGKSPDVLFMAALSGGGKRSAAFAYGVFNELNKHKIQLRNISGQLSQDMSLLQEIDVMTGVSGGSLTASYYALHRENIFLPREEKCGFESFLYEDTGAVIWGMYLLPWKWNWAFDSSFGSNDVLADHFAKRLFQKPSNSGCPEPFSETDLRPNGATYQDLFDRGAPLLLVEATDITRGMSFPFTQDGFDLLCSDISQFPVAWAVAASSAFPIILSTVNLTNNHGASQSSCKPHNNLYVQRIQNPSFGCTPIEVLLDVKNNEVLSDRDLFRSSILWESAVSCFVNPGDGKYLHLADGGATDNYALRGLVDWLMSNEQTRSPAFWEVVHNTKRALLLIIDGQKDVDPKLSRKQDGPTLFEAAEAMVSNTVDNGNLTSLADTMSMLETVKEYLAVRDVIVVERMIKSCNVFGIARGESEVGRFRRFVDVMMSVKADGKLPAGGLAGCNFSFDLEFDRYTSDARSQEKVGALNRAVSNYVGVLRWAEWFGKQSLPWDHVELRKILGRLIGKPEQGASIEEIVVEATLLRHKLEALEVYRGKKVGSGSTYFPGAQLVRLVKASVIDDCDTARREALLRSDTGLGLPNEVVDFAIAAGKDVARLHLDSISAFLSSGVLRDVPSCEVWKAKDPAAVGGGRANQSDR